MMILTQGKAKEMLAEAEQANRYREELIERIARAHPHDGVISPLPGIRLSRASERKGPAPGVNFPTFCIIVQGMKEILLGTQRYQYDPDHYVLSTIELPILIQRVEASPDKPYLTFQFDLDTALVASVMLDAGMPSPRQDSKNARAIDVSPLDSKLLEAAVRIMRLVEASEAEVKVLLPLMQRELIFRLLMGEQSTRLRRMAVLGGHTDRIARAIVRLRTDFDKSFRIENLAHELGMSPSAFHDHFKAVTALSPLQFQKQFRLQEARRLLLSGDVDAASAGYRVGYEDASQFNKEYKRFFGQPPMRDVENLRAVHSESR